MSNRKKLSRDQKRKRKKAKQEQQHKKLQQRLAVQVGEVDLATLVENFRKRMAEMWTHEKIESMETDAIVQKLKEIGIDFDEEVFCTQAENFYSPSDLAEHLWKTEMDQIEGVDGDFTWMAAGVLWKRLCPDLANKDTIIDGIGEGDELLKEKGLAAACDRWLQVWEDLKSRFLEGTKSIATVEDRAGDYYSMKNCLISFDEELRKVGLEDPTYLEKRIVFCQEVVELLPESPSEFLEQMEFGKSESYFMLGDAKAGDAAFQRMVEKYPDKSWLIYGSWGDCWTEKYGAKVPADLLKAKELYEKAVGLAPPEEVERIQERIEELEDSQS